VLLTSIQAHLDEYLSVCQVGITLASVALGMVGEKTAELITGESTGSAWRYAVAIGVSYLLISGSHILLGELVPKSIAIRIADRSAIWSAKPLRFFHRLFFPALWLLTLLSNGILRLVGLGPATSGEHHSEKELRIILDQSQERGMMSFRRLLFMENVFDLGALTVRDAMRQRARVHTLDVRLPWTENLRVIRTARFTRYPLITTDPARPTGFVHVKDLVIRGDSTAPDLQTLARPLLATTETTPLETLFAEMQRRRIHVALVTDSQGQWTGFVTLEDAMEELVGTIRDEFEDEEPVRLADALTVDRVHFDVEADSPVAAVRMALARMRPDALPLPADQMLRAIDVRERLVGTYLGHGIGMPHARVAGLDKPFVMLVRSEGGVGCEGTTEKGHLLFVLLTPAGQPRVHQRLLSIIATLLHESEYVKERLMTVTTAEEVLEVIRTGEQAVLD
jgi:CBS domain containing-hemolysin-like protein